MAASAVRPLEIAQITNLMLGAWHGYCCWKGSFIGSPRARAYFAPIPKMHHLVLTFLGSLIIGYLGVLLAFSLEIGLKVLMPTVAVVAFLAAGAFP